MNAEERESLSTAWQGARSRWAAAIDGAWAREVYAGLCMATVFLGALLLFQVQPIVGKMILPRFGGTPAVWMTCMLFFQVILLAGYAYSHLIAVRLSLRAQGLVHLALLLLVLTQLPLSISDAWKPDPHANPSGQILILLVRSVAAPLLLLSATGPLLQSWFSHMLPGRTCYRLYALSNAGSFLALLSYPFVVEPVLRLQTQAQAWSRGSTLFVLFCSLCAAGVAAGGSTSRTARVRQRVKASADATIRASAPGAIDVLLWLGLAACGSTMLLAVTNQLCQNVAAVPLLWIVPLAIYLLTFVLCFDHPRWYARSVFMWALVVVLLASSLLLLGLDLGLATQMGIYLGLLFVCCMCCHGELNRIRPPASHLTSFFLMLALGGALGGVFVSLVAPSVFTLFLELPIALFGTCVLVLAARRRDELRSLASRSTRRGLALVVGSGSLGCLAMVACADKLVEARAHRDGVLSMTRNFYGTLRVAEKDGHDPSRRRLQLAHGTTDHGDQFTDPAKRRWATTYFGPHSGVGVALRHQRDAGQRSGLKVGVIGLGVGTIAAYAEDGDAFHFYEINPSVAELANAHFTYLENARARGAGVEIHMGDGRMLLERQLAANGPQGFDVLVVDAFNSDAIPVHLLTEECFGLYWEHLDPDGILAVHVSNRFLDLGPVVRGLADSWSKSAFRVDSAPDLERGVHLSNWILVARPALLGQDVPEIRSLDPARSLLWTDDYSSLIPLLR